MNSPTFIPATRVQIVCPCGTSASYRATNRVIALLLHELKVKAWGRFSYSHVSPPVFIGQFWNRERWEEDKNVLIFIDIPDQSLDDILEHFIKMREKINAEYTDAPGKEPGKSVWITAHHMHILSN